MKYENQTFDEERALYGVHDAHIVNCVFDGPADGESALKECGRLTVDNCDMNLRYPFWHVNQALISNCRMPETCRAALWYDRDVTLRCCIMNGIKALRECDHSVVEDCTIHSPEFGWICRGITVKNTELISEYPFFQSKDLKIDGLHMKGKYSFQYVENAVIKNSVLDTKDAFWHSKNVTVVDCIVKGEYLAWYSENLKLVRCKIIGTQPLCYAKGLVLENCEMENTDLAFEKSQVTASVKGSILSVKNPAEGKIEADRIGEIILDEYQGRDTCCEIVCREQS